MDVLLLQLLLDVDALLLDLREGEPGLRDAGRSPLRDGAVDQVGADMLDSTELPKRQRDISQKCEENFE